MSAHPVRGWILVAEDDAAERQAMRELLEGSQYRVDVVVDGAEALEFLRSARKRGELPDVMVTDLDMPRVSGADMITVLKNDPHYSRMPIVVLSAFEHGALPLFQVERMLAKPVRSDTLLRVVAELSEGGSPSKRAAPEGHDGTGGTGGTDGPSS